MHDARAQVALLVAKLREACEQAVDERAALVAGRRVDNHTGRLVHDDHRRIFEHDVEWHVVLGRQVEMARLRCDQDPIAGRDALARLAGQAVQQHRLDADESLPLGA